jgi:hypothetical protein
MSEEYKYGLVLKHKGSLFLVPFDDEGNIDRFGDSITDTNNIYENLKPNAISFVVTDSYGDALNVRDLRTITITNEKFADEEVIAKMIELQSFSEVAKNIWTGWFEDNG